MDRGRWGSQHGTHRTLDFQKKKKNFFFFCGGRGWGWGGGGGGGDRVVLKTDQKMTYKELLSTWGLGVGLKIDQGLTQTGFLWTWGVGGLK